MLYDVEPLLASHVGVSEVSKYTRPSYSRCAGIYYRYVNPWIRLLSLIPILYFYSVLLNLTTYRDVKFQSQMANNTRPEMIHPIFDMSRNKTAFILPDVLYDVITPSPFPSAEYNSWKAFIDSSPGVWCSLAILFFIAQRNMLRLTEYTAIHMMLFVIQGFLKAFTNYPAPDGVQPSCNNPDYLVFGTWVFNNFTVDYCGDQMFSGHTSETVIAMILLRRLIWDYVGWGFARTEEQEAFNYELIARQSRQYKLSQVRIDDSSHHEGNEDFFFYEMDIYSTRKWVQRHRTLVWLAITSLRFVMLIWLFVFFYALLHNRQHYSADITVAVFMSNFICSCRTAQVLLIRWLYRPNYWNYLRTGLFPVYLSEPLTCQQLNFERRMGRAGRGGII